jgi:hypothetical protein
VRDGERLPRRQIAEGDVLYSVDGVRVKGRRLPEVIQMLKGPSGTEVAVIFQLRADGAAPPGARRGPAPQGAPGGPFEMLVEIIAAGGLPTSGATPTGLCDAFCCVSVCPDGIPPPAAAALAGDHRRAAQARTKARPPPAARAPRCGDKAVAPWPPA